MKRLFLLLAALMILPLIIGCTTKPGESNVSQNQSEAVSNTTSKEESKEESMAPINYVDTIERHPTTIVKQNDSNYIITTELYGGTYKRTFYKRSWGTWNIGSMAFKPAEGAEIEFVSASTDWEYVFRAGQTAATQPFVGGNHDNEKMIDIAFYNGVTGEKLNLDDKKPVTVDLLKIVENTAIYFDKQPDNVFANVERIYYYAGKSIYNECNYEIVQDTHFSLSYTAMFPINKDYGTRIVYHLGNGKTREWTSSKVGKADYSGPMDKNNAALEVDIYGHKDPRYIFNVKVHTKADSTGNFGNGSKTFYWDMNAGQNKLYFSRFPDTGATLVKKGAKWNTLTSWSFNYDENNTYTEPEESK